MSRWVELQQGFQQAILASDPTPGLFVREDEALEGGIDLYLNAYRIRLSAALADNYPVLRLAMGDEAFDELAAHYLAAHPSPHRSIRWFGDRLCEFIATHPDLIPHPALVDLARMDWALRNAFDAADQAPDGVEILKTLAAEDWPGLRFDLHPSVALLDLAWQIEPIWHALNRNADAATEAPEDLNHTLLVWRKGLECLWRSLEPIETSTLRLAADGASFAEICEALIGIAGEHQAASRAVTLLQQWLNDGLLVRRS
jgi:hypothetical protein